MNRAKTIIIFILVILLTLVFFGCRDDSLDAQIERAKSAADSANRAYESAQDQLNKIYRDKELYDLTH
jgi:uncharacterized membrane protein